MESKNVNREAVGAIAAVLALVFGVVFAVVMLFLLGCVLSSEATTLEGMCDDILRNATHPEAPGTMVWILLVVITGMVLGD